MLVFAVPQRTPNANVFLIGVQERQSEEPKIREFIVPVYCEMPSDRDFLLASFLSKLRPFIAKASELVFYPAQIGGPESLPMAPMNADERQAFNLVASVRERYGEEIVVSTYSN